VRSAERNLSLRAYARDSGFKGEGRKTRLEKCDDRLILGEAKRSPRIIQDRRSDPSKFGGERKAKFSADYRPGRASSGQIHLKTSTIRPRVHPMQSGASQWSRFNVTRIRTTLSFGPCTRVTARATNPASDYRAWRKRGRLTGPRRQGSRKRGARKGARKSEGKRE